MVGKVIDIKERGILIKLVIKLGNGKIEEVYDNRKVYDILEKGNAVK